MPATSVDPGRRSRKGCHNCRARRKKCDEVRPICGACFERRETCRYENTGKPKHYRPPPLAPAVASNEALVVSPRGALIENEEFLIQHFCNGLAELICFRPDGANNPWSLHLMPLVQSSSLVLGAVESISTAHLHVLGSKPLSEAQSMQSNVLRALSSHIASETLDAQSAQLALAATLLMVILGGSAEYALCHLKGAKALTEQVANLPATVSHPGFRFLIKIFHYFDVMVALSLRRSPLSGPYVLDQEPGVVDEVFGLTAGLWPTMHRLARILAINDLETATVRSTEGAALAKELVEWRTGDCHGLATAGNECSVDEETTIQIADAYRCSALLVLHHEFPSTQHSEYGTNVYRQALESVLRTAALDGPMATLVWPLFTVGKYSQSPSDRTILRHIFSKLFNRQHMKVVDSARRGIDNIWKSESENGSALLEPVFFA